MVSRHFRWGVVAFAATPQCTFAAEAAPAPAIGSVLQVSLGLGIVLLMVVGAAWLLRRLGLGTPRSDGTVTVRGGVAVGQRERVVVVEIDDTWLVIGVSPGRVNALHALPRPQGVRAVHEATPAPFAQWLKRALERTHA